MDLIKLFIENDVEDGSGVSAVATVDAPAIEEPFFAFNKKQLKKYTIAFGNQKGDFKPIEIAGDKQIIAGALMIPDKKIYRKDDATGYEYEVYFTPDTIKAIQAKYAKMNLNGAVNEMHDANKPVNGFMFQQFVIDRKMGIIPPLNQNHLVDGTWFGYIKIEDTKMWNEFIKTGIYTGFSVEGHFYEEKVQDMTDNDMNELADILDSL